VNQSVVILLTQPQKQFHAPGSIQDSSDGGIELRQHGEGSSSSSAGWKIVGVSQSKEDVETLCGLLGSICELDDARVAGHQITDQFAGSALDARIARKK
jgi:hypothetical protein